MWLWLRWASFRSARSQHMKTISFYDTYFRFKGLLIFLIRLSSKNIHEDGMTIFYAKSAVNWHDTVTRVTIKSRHVNFRYRWSILNDYVEWAFYKENKKWDVRRGVNLSKPTHLFSWMIININTHSILFCSDSSKLHIPYWILMQWICFFINSIEWNIDVTKYQG